MFDFEGLVGELLKIPVTKRNILKIGAKFYAYLGLISPVTVISKVFFQKVCLSDKHWDEILSDDITKGWTLHLEQLAIVKSIIIPRYVFRSC